MLGHFLSSCMTKKKKVDVSMFISGLLGSLVAITREYLLSSSYLKSILLCLHDMMGNISVHISGFHLTNQTVQQWQKPTFIRTPERMLHVTHHTMPHIMHIHIS